MKKLILIFAVVLSSSLFAETRCVINNQATDLAEITKQTFENQAQTLETFKLIEACFAQHPNDHRIVFAQVYGFLTIGLFSLPARQKFEDLEWYAKLLIGTADRYRRALHAYETGDFANTPEVWKVAFDAYKNKKVSTPLNLFLGMNAHITYDIVLALLDIQTDFSKKAQYNDFRSLNPYFTEITPALWSIVEAHEGKHRGKLHRNFKAFVVNKWIIFHRLRTWDRAEKLDAFKNDKKKVSEYIAWLDKNAKKRSKRFLAQKVFIKSNELEFDNE